MKGFSRQTNVVVSWELGHVPLFRFFLPTCLIEMLRNSRSFAKDNSFSKMLFCFGGVDGLGDVEVPRVLSKYRVLTSDGRFHMSTQFAVVDGVVVSRLSWLFWIKILTILAWGMISDWFLWACGILGSLIFDSIVMILVSRVSTDDNVVVTGPKFRITLANQKNRVSFISVGSATAMVVPQKTSKFIDD